MKPGRKVRALCVALVIVPAIARAVPGVGVGARAGTLQVEENRIAGGTDEIEVLLVQKGVYLITKVPHFIPELVNLISKDLLSFSFGVWLCEEFVLKCPYLLS